MIVFAHILRTISTSQNTPWFQQITIACKFRVFVGRGATTAEKLRGDQGLGPNTGALAPRAWPKAALCWVRERSPPLAVRVRGYHPRKIFENSDAKSCILVTTCCEISCFFKTTAKKLGTNTLLVPQPKSFFWGGTSLPRSLRLLRLCS